MGRRKFHIVDKLLNAVDMSRTKYYRQDKAGNTVIHNPDTDGDIIDVAQPDEIIYSGNKGDIRKGEMIERNISILNNTKANKEDLDVVADAVSAGVYSKQEIDTQMNIKANKEDLDVVADVVSAGVYSKDETDALLNGVDSNRIAISDTRPANPTNGTIWFKI